MPTSSSTPGIDRSSSTSTSARSSQVPCSMISPSGRRWATSHRAKARCAFNSTASRFVARARGAADSRTPSASPSECAGSVETRSTRRALRAPRTDSANAELQVVLPTPPLPAKNTRLGLGAGGSGLGVLVGLEAFNVDAGDPVLRRHREGALLRPLDRADPGEHVALDLRELGVGDLAELEAHLRLEQPIAERGVVVHLRLPRRDDLVEDEAKAADEE